jgi:hypothetical protein
MNSSETRLIFDWRKARWDYRLPAFIAISFLGHFFCFYLFHVVYPPTTSLLPPAAQITVLDPGSSRDKNMLDWIEVNDPATVSAPRFNPSLVPNLTPRYKPFFSTLEPELRSLEPPETSSKSIASIFSAETLIPMRPRPQTAAPGQRFPTRLEVASTLEKRSPASLPVLPVTSTLAEPTSFFIGVNPEGEVDFLFLRTSSGSDPLDERAKSYVKSLRFQPGTDRDWGVVSIHWGGSPS